jgi:hypothetical protein
MGGHVVCGGAGFQVPEWMFRASGWLLVTDPEPALNGIEPGQARRVPGRSAAYAPEKTGFVDMRGIWKICGPIVGHAGGLWYCCDRIYKTIPVSAIVSYEVIEEYEPVSGHRPVVAAFNLEAANPVPPADRAL